MVTLVKFFTVFLFLIFFVASIVSHSIAFCIRVRYLKKENQIVALINLPIYRYFSYGIVSSKLAFTIINACVHILPVFNEDYNCNQMTKFF